VSGALIVLNSSEVTFEVTRRLPERLPESIIESATGGVMKFTEMAIRKMKPNGKKYYARADLGNGKNGFAICVYPSGAKSWFFIYTFEGKRYSMGLGNYPEVGIAQAAEKFDEHWAVLKGGKNPAMLEGQRKEERRKAPTVAGLAEEYLERHAKRFKKSWKEDERIIYFDIIPAWGNLKAADIRKRDVIALLEKIVERGSPSMANNTFRLIRKIFNYAVEKDILPYTPCDGIKEPSPKTARERVLTEEEIKTFWKNLDGCYVSDDVQRALKLILVTGQRPGEVAGMHAREIEGRWWTIPSERAKNGRAHRVYLTDTALDLIGNIDSKSYVFPTPRKANEKPVDAHALAVAVRRNLAFDTVDVKGKKSKVNRLGVEHFTPHDLRRTAATFMAQMGVMDEVIDSVLNHAKQGVIRVYNQYRYDREKQAALESWSRKLESMVKDTESNVIPFRKGKLP
jgi:integrase